MVMKHFLMAILVATFMANHPISAAGEATVSPSEEAYGVSPAGFDFDNELLHKYSPNYLKYLEGCAAKMNWECAKEAFVDILESKPMTKQCCVSLIKMGIDCHVGLADMIFKTYEFKNDAFVGVPRSKEVWNRCIREVGPEIAAPMQFES